jgi:branched-chain amino acid transport system substrate-binding protein
LKALDPDLVIIFGYPATSTTFVKQCRELNYYPRALQATYITAELFEEALGSDVNGIYWGTWYDYRYQIDENPYWVSLWQKKYPNIFPYLAFAWGIMACQVLKAAIEKAGSIDREAVRDALETIDVMTVAGRCKFHPTEHWNLYQYEQEAVYQFQRGKVEIVYPPDKATAKPIHPLPPWGAKG